MSETTTTTEPTPEITPEPVATDDTLGDPGKRALDAERKARRAAEKAAADAVAKVKEYEDAQKSEAERLAAKVAELEATAAKATAEALRQRIVNETGIPADLAGFVTGPDEDTMRANAQLLASKIGPAQKAGPASTRPVESLQPGSGKADSGPAQLTRSDLQGMKPEQIVAAKAAGQLNTLLGIS